MSTVVGFRKIKVNNNLQINNLPPKIDRSLTTVDVEQIQPFKKSGFQLSVRNENPYTMN